VSERHYLAFDLGAESGRAVLGTLESGRIALAEVHRFPNAPLEVLGGLRWNVYGLFEEVRKGLALAAQAADDIASVAVDTWGVDFGLLGPDGDLLGLPFAYRDPRNLPAMEKFLEIISRRHVYELTGIQFLPFNTLFQLYAMILSGSSALRAADRLQFMPGLLTYLLSGVRATDTTIASTSQLLDPRRGSWSEELFAALGLSNGLMGESVLPGTVLGHLRPAVAAAAGLGKTAVAATAGHDTAAAVAAIPATGTNWAYISSGTWSLVGIETASPLITEETRRLNFTNEGGMGGRIRFLKNVTGLWLVAQCRKSWRAVRAVDYDELTALAEAAPPFKALLDPDAPEFLNPPDMPAAIQAFCRRTGQSVPQTPGEIVRCALESLALKYRAVLDDLGRVSPHPIEKVHVIGGGSRNGLLNGFTAAATGLPVIAGPVEATAIGNILGQALALGDIGSLEDMRSIVAASAGLRVFDPEGKAAWDEAFDRFREVLARGSGDGMGEGA
jgi:rhamnulokinase